MRASNGRVLLLATTNPGKVKELEQELACLGIEILTVASIPGYQGPEETGSTFAENAIIKAEAACRASGYPALADDSGLEVDALDGAPGVYSARFGGPTLSDPERCRLLLQRLTGVPLEARTARFKAVLALARPGSTTLLFTGVVEGWVGFEPRGSNGFGYDPVFYLRDPETGSFLDRSMAQLTPQEKAAISHRGQAARKLRRALESGEAAL